MSEAEYCALYFAWKWTKWLREVLQDMGFGEWVQKPTYMFGDNRNARDWAIEDMTTDGNRMIDRKSATRRCIILVLAQMPRPPLCTFLSTR
eukprot:COSAG01_NODE_1363_length_10560_cov_2530.174773_4_plen_91_part_00